MPGFLADIRESSVPFVVIENIFCRRGVPEGRTRRAIPLYVHGPSSGKRSGLQVKVHIVRDKQIEMPVTVIIHPGAARIPTYFRPGLDQACAFRHVRKRSVAMVVIQRVLAVVGDEQIVIAIVIVIADAAGLSPSRPKLQARSL